MRKKLLLEQNTQLFDKVERAEELISELKKQIAEQKDIINEQKNEIERLNASLNATEPLKNLESKVIKQASLTPEVDYGSAVIGKTVVEAAKYCNSLTADGENDNAKELVNLILGRTEVAKAEILKIVSLEEDFEAKKQKIDEQYDNAIDYFKSIMAQ